MRDTFDVVLAMFRALAPAIASWPFRSPKVPFIGENRQLKSPRLVLLDVEFCKTWSRMEGDSGESGDPCSQEPIGESAREILEHCV